MAISLDYGKCTGCGNEQSKSLDNCRHCGAALPWNKGAAKRQKVTNSSPRMGIGDIAWAAMAVQLSGGALVVGGIAYRFASRADMLPRVPFLSLVLVVIGVALWGYGSRMD